MLDDLEEARAGRDAGDRTVTDASHPAALDALRDLAAGEETFTADDLRDRLGGHPLGLDLGARRLVHRGGEAR
jgi:hypothetical protein